MRDILRICYQQFQLTAPTFTHKEAKELVLRLKKCLKQKSLDPEKWKRAVLAVIVLLEKGTYTIQWFIFFMDFYRNGVIMTTRNLGKRILETTDMSSSKRIKLNEQDSGKKST